MIRKFLAYFFLLFVSAGAWSQAKISVHINNFENNAGNCIVCLYNNPKEFTEKGGKPVACLTVPITNKTAIAQFEEVQPGSYAIMVVHDANSNRKFDTNFLGIPKEGYGASKNILPFAAAPKFEENRIVVTDSTTTRCTIKLRYIF